MPAYKDKTNNTWYIKYQNKTKRGFETKREALLYEAKLKLNPNSECARITFKEVALDYLSYKKIDVSYATYDKSRNAVERHIFPYFKVDKLISKISDLDCRHYFEILDGLNYSTIYKNAILLTFKSIFKHTMKFYNLRTDPTAFINRYKPTFDENMKSKAKEINIWNDEEFNQFINEVKRPIHRGLFIMLYFTGMRLGEALAITWNDFKDESVIISKSITRKTSNAPYEVKEPKNISSYRTISLGSNLAQYFNNIKIEEMKIPGFSEEWFMFGRVKPLALVTIDRIKEAAIQKSGVKRIRIHDFRHSHASNLIASGVNIVAVSKRLGHSDVNTTLRVYTHLFKKSDNELIDIIDEQFYKLRG